MKTCTVCKESKSLDDFYNSKKSKDGKGYRCKVCDNKARANADPTNKRASQRKNNLWTKYRLTPEDYDRMLAEQGGGCAICGLPEADNKVGHHVDSLSVDHDHKTGKIRGLLCNQCNRGVGMLQDSSALLRRAADYLDNN